MPPAPSGGGTCTGGLSGKEPDRDPSILERRGEYRPSGLERTAKVGDARRQDAQVLGSFGPAIRRLELVGHDPGQDGRVAQGRPDRVVPGGSDGRFCIERMFSLTDW